MSSVTELVELLKQGAISKDELLTRMRSPDVTISSSFASNARLPEDLQWSLPISPRELTPVDPMNEEERPLAAPQMSAASLHPAPVSLRSSVSYNRLSPEQFYAYQTNWKRSRQEVADQLKEQLQAEEVKDCTFHPKTNPVASPAVSPAFDRLYQVKDPRYLEMVRRQFRAKEEEAALKECSFQPRINTRSHSVVSKHKEVREVRINPRTLMDIEKECTFVPKVNQVKRGMTAAQEYVAADPFERLTRVKPKEMPTEFTGGNFVASALASSRKDERPAEISDMTTFSQKTFFERQALFEIMKSEKKLQLAQQSVTQPPVILERSKKMVTDTFEQRNNKLLEKRTKPLQQYDSECTFAPTISRKAQEKRKRTVEELSYGDAEKKEQRLASLKDALDQRALSANIPQMSTSNLSVSSHLQLSTDMETYLARVQQEKDRKAAVVEKIRMERQSREMRECTYAPITKDAPSYIKRMARSVAMLKAEMPPAAPPEKPEWR